MEVLIAVTITAVIGLGVWQVLGNVVSSRDRVNEVAEQFDNIQRTMLLLERDITQVVNRSARDIYGDFRPALTSREEEFSLILTRQLAQPTGHSPQQSAAGGLGIHRG